MMTVPNSFENRYNLHELEGQDAHLSRTLLLAIELVQTKKAERRFNC